MLLRDVDKKIHYRYERSIELLNGALFPVCLIYIFECYIMYMVPIEQSPVHFSESRERFVAV